ncbi:MAG: hypothetical protein HYV47_02310 [Candidatus Nealsonbacteria bacterium]|nr:hypothetical protein [Candidatus Nealsonbacteria bacterium]
MYNVEAELYRAAAAVLGKAEKDELGVVNELIIKEQLRRAQGGEMPVEDVILRLNALAGKETLFDTAPSFSFLPLDPQEDLTQKVW